MQQAEEQRKKFEEDERLGRENKEMERREKQLQEEDMRVKREYEDLELQRKEEELRRREESWRHEEEQRRMMEYQMEKERRQTEQRLEQDFLRDEGSDDTETEESDVQGTEESTDLKKLMQERPPQDLKGSVVIDFTIRPARGGFALVYQGVCQGIKVAVKETAISVRQSRQPSLRRRVHREISVWSALRHENILQLLGFTEGHGDYPALISPWCKNGTADEYLKQNVSIHKRFSLAQDVANGLQYLHSLKIIHGDLKPKNILISDDEVALLCDFGLVALQDWQGLKGFTTTSPYSATVLYTAPELVESRDPDQLRATCPGDIYAFGCVIFEFVEGKELYGHLKSRVRLEDAKRNGEMPAKRPPLKKSEECVKHFWRLLEECWDPEPEERPNSTEALDGVRYIIDLLSMPNQ